MIEMLLDYNFGIEEVKSKNIELKLATREKKLNYIGNLILLKKETFKKFYLFIEFKTKFLGYGIILQKKREKRKGKHSSE